MKWKLYFILLLLAALFTSCKTVEQATTIYRTQIDTVYISNHSRDSIFVKDSIYIKEKNDTIWMKEWHTKYIDREILDTIYINKSDTCYIDKLETVHEKYIPKWVWWVLGITGTVTLIVLIIFIWKIYKKFHCL